MTWSPHLVFLLQIAVMGGAALVFGRVAVRLGQPPLLGELLGGVVLGPTLLGALAPQAFAWLFPASGQAAAARDGVLTLGMLFFLFVAGLEVNLADLKGAGRAIFAISASSVAVPFALGVAAVYAWPALWGDGYAGDPTTLALFAGTALSISALPVIARTLIDLGLLGSRIGGLILASATASDVVGWALFALVITRVRGADASAPGLALVLPALLAIGGVCRWVCLPALVRIQKNHSSSSLLAALAVTLVAAAAAAEASGSHATLGAFVAGLAVGSGLGPREGNRAHDAVYHVAVSIFAPLYFVSVGLRVDVAANFDPVLVAVVMGLAVAGKLLGAWLGGRLGGMGRRETLAVGFGLNARGAMEMILASVALEQHVIDERIFVALVVMAVGTSALGPPFLRRFAAPERA